MNFYQASSYDVLKKWIANSGGEIISNRQAVLMTNDPAFIARFYRQHVTETGSGTLLVENAIRTAANPPIKIYWSELRVSSAGVTLHPLSRKRPGHYVPQIESVPWLANSF
jgi:hypothetical protein